MSQHKDIPPFGGQEGHVLTPVRGRVFSITRPFVSKGSLAVKFKVTPSNGTNYKHARIRLMLNLIFLQPIENFIEA